MRLAEGRQWFDVLASGDASWPTASRRSTCRALAVADVFGFLALRETAPCPPCRRWPMRAWRISIRSARRRRDAELARRRRAGLTPQQDAMLVRWGYPYVFETWFFHMTLTRRLTAAEKARLPTGGGTVFRARASAVPRRVSDICLFAQPAPGEPFVIAERLTLRG